MKQFWLNVLIKRQVSKESSEQVHEKHGEEWDLGHTHHPSTAAAFQLFIDRKNSRMTDEWKGQNRHSIDSLWVEDKISRSAGLFSHVKRHTMGETSWLGESAIYCFINYQSNFHRTRNLKFLANHHNQKEHHTQQGEATGVSQIP